MCLGPHEMTRETIQAHIEQFREYVAEFEGGDKQWAEGELAQYERLAKDIDNGELTWNEKWGEWEPVKEEEKEESWASQTG